MTEPTANQPSTADLLAAIQALTQQTSQRFDRVEQRFDEADRRFETMAHRFDQIDHRFDRVDAGIAQVRADLAAVKVDTAYTEAHIGDLHEAIRRHINSPTAHGQAAA